MKRIANIGLMMLMAWAFSACSSYQYYASSPTSVSLSKYKTFAWASRLPNSKPDTVIKGKQDIGARLNYINNNRYYNNPEAREKIKSAAIRNMQSKGFVLQENSPDLILRYTTLVDRGARDTYYSMYGGYGWGYPWWRPYYWYGAWGWPGYAGYPVREHFKEGVLSIELIDRRTKEPVWVGYSSGELNSDPQKVMADLPKVVDDIFKRLPVVK